MTTEMLLNSDGKWHRGQRNRIAFETACYYSYEAELPNGCQYDLSQTSQWLSDPGRMTDRLALVALYQSLEGDSWRYSDNWNQGDPCWDFWYGITCDEHGRVIYLEMVDNRLAGVLDAALGDLTSLMRLDVSSTNEVYMGYPNLYLNRIRGPIPSMKDCRRLQEIIVDGNFITTFPDDLFENSETIRIISASRNKLTDFPKKLERFANLHTLELSRNQIDDQFPTTEFRRLLNIRVVQLDYNLIKGPLEKEIADIPEVEIFDVSHNVNLDGELPESIIVTWNQIEYISVLNTSLQGYVASLCRDVPFCWKFMYDTHKDLTWATAADVPDIVNSTMELALSRRRVTTEAETAVGRRLDEER